MSVEQAIDLGKKRAALTDQLRRYRHMLVVFGNHGGNTTVMRRQRIPNLTKHDDVLSDRHACLPQDLGGSTNLSQPPAPGAGPLLVMIPTWRAMPAKQAMAGSFARRPDCPMA
jgi:hypothetical protein